MTQHKLDLVRPFGPVIAKAKIPEDIVSELNNYIDEIIVNQNKSKQLDHGSKLVGNVKQEIAIEKEFAKKIGWLDFLGNCTSKWIEVSTGKKISKFHIIESWVVRQFKNEYNAVHWHGGHISGAGFLKVPSTFGKPFQENKKDFNGKLTLIHGSKSFLSNSKLDILPIVGDFYFFPHYLMHSVYPFTDSDEERRSISFNAKIDEGIFNVFGGQ